MEISSILIGIVLGSIIAYILFSLMSKGKNVARTEYDSLSVKMNETTTHLRLTEDRLKSQLELTTERIKELQYSLTEQATTNKIQQEELNHSKQKVA